MRTTKILAAILAIVMLVGTLASCGSAYKTPNEFITLPELGKITVKYADLVDKLKEQKDEILEGSKGQVFEPVADGVIQNGDQVYFDYTGTATGISEDLLNTLKGEGTYLTIGSESTSFPVDYTNKNDNKTDNDAGDTTVLQEGFEKQLIGHKVGDKVEIKATFANNYTTNAELKNVEVTYTVTVKAVARITVNNNFTVKLTYTVTDDITKIDEDKLLPVITTPATETSAKPEEEATPEAQADTTAADTTTTPGTTATPDTTATPFNKLFPDVTSATSFDLTDKTKTFGTIFTVGDLIPYMEGKHLYDEFTIQLTVPEDYKDDKYAAYRGKTIYYTIDLTGTSSTPEWTDYFVNKYTSKEYETVAKYEEYLNGENKKSLAYDAIYEATNVLSYPKKEWEDSYKNYVEQYLCDHLADVDNKQSVSLSDYTPSEIKEKVKDSDYQKIWDKATVSARDAVKQRLVMEALFLELGIEISRSEYKELMAEEEEEFNANLYYYYIYYQIVDFDQYVNYNGGKEYFELMFKYDKLLEKLPEIVIYEEKPAE